MVRDRSRALLQPELLEEHMATSRGSHRSALQSLQTTSKHQAELLTGQYSVCTCAQHRQASTGVFPACAGDVMHCRWCHCICRLTSNAGDFAQICRAASISVGLVMGCGNIKKRLNSRASSTFGALGEPVTCRLMRLKMM